MRPRPSLLVALLLFALTGLTTTLAYGPLYALAVLAILGAHEMGHWVMCRRHGVASSYPIFFPFPPLAAAGTESLFRPGTLGALIAIRSPVPSRKALLDIGAAGPLAGLAVALPLTYLGLALSTVKPAPPPTPDWPRLGTSLLFDGLTWLAHGRIPPGHDVFLHPVALAGWFGFLITAMNLLPIGQLDGGHIVYALLGPEGARRTTWTALAAFALLTLLVYNWWLLFLVIVAVVARRHPAPIDDRTPLDPRRRRVALAALAALALTFVPVPMAGLPSLWGP